MKVKSQCDSLSIFLLIVNHFTSQKYLIISGIFTCLVFFETIRSRRLEYLAIALIDSYFWICVYSLYETMKINERINRKFFEIKIEELKELESLKV